MQSKVIPYSADNEYFFQEGCFINEMSNSTEDNALSIARACVRPQEKTRWHKLRDRIERYVILQGTGYVEIGQTPPQRVSIGDVVLIPADCPQRIENRGDEDLVFLALCTPRFTPDSYIDIDDEEKGSF
ncbi:MAG: cupin domain-containing protein [Candidatus Thiodiazotropha sp. (ex Monitilora ramsayi)]|nr:cupin domain-containing protein [Candidatus Thiodiazotropha sp. (ex Monitilora ramsayi)]